MIDHKYKTIFIHTRKCAGTSIIRSFGYYPSDFQWHAFNDGTQSVNPIRWNVVKEKFPNYFIVSVVRNPWDRFISGWKYLNSTKNKSLSQVLDNLPTSGHDYRHLTRPQSQILFFNQTPVCHQILRFERLQEDYDAWCERIGKPFFKLEKLNSSHSTQKDDYQHFFSETDRLKFFSHFKEDIIKFNYNFNMHERY